MCRDFIASREVGTPTQAAEFRPGGTRRSKAGCFPKGKLKEKQLSWQLPPPWEQLGPSSLLEFLSTLQVSCWDVQTVPGNSKLTLKLFVTEDPGTQINKPE